MRNSYFKLTKRKFCTTQTSEETKSPIFNFGKAERTLISKRLSQLPLYSLKPTIYKGDAAVLVPLCYKNNQSSILFTLRSGNVGTHKHQVSFPGGKKEPRDENIITAALRETEEELNVPNLKEKIEVLGTFRQALSITNYVVTPVIGFIDDIDTVLKDHSPSPEIEEVFFVSLSQLTDKKYISWENLNRGTLPVFSAQHRIWGLTSCN